MALTRRTFLLGSTAATVATACGGGSESSSASDLGPDTGAGSGQGSGDVVFLAITFPDGFRTAPSLVAGIPQRLAFLVSDEIDYLREAAPRTVELTISQNANVVATETLSLHSDGIVTPYYPLRFTFSEPGEYEAALPEYGGVDPVPFIVTTSDEVAMPQVGSALPVVATPTVDAPRGVNPICTRAVPCPFHEHNLADVIDNGRPTAILVATPGFCQTEICGPVVDLLIDAADGREGIDLIHAEVYTDPSVFETGRFPDTTDAVNALGLPFEPALFVADSTGTIVERLDAIWDRTEAAAALDQVS